MEEHKTELVENPGLNAYIKEFQEDVKLSQMNIREKSMTCSSIWAKWIAYLFKERENVQRIADYRQQIIKSKSQNTKLTDSVLRMKSEDKLTENDAAIKKLDELKKQTQSNIDFIEHALNVLQNFGFTIKNAIESFKLTMEH